MRANCHVHLFSADHTPSAQLYHLLRGAFHGAARGLLPAVLGRPCTTEDLQQFDRSMDRFEWPWPILFRFAIGMALGSGQALMVDPKRLARMFRTVARVTEADVHRILGVGASEAEADLLRSIVDRVEARRAAGSALPYRDALCDLVRELFAAHLAGVGQGGAVTQRELWSAFMSAPGADLYQQVIVLSVNFDEAFLPDVLPGLDGEPRLDFQAQAAELETLAAEVNAQGGVQIVPFLGVEPRGSSVASLDAWVRERVGATRPWKGLKIYPPMGYRPADRRLVLPFEYCQDGGFPVLSHCSIGGAGIRGTESNYAELASPHEWLEVLARLEARHLTGQAHGTFRLCLAHFDRLEEPLADTWCQEIMDLMERFDGTKGVQVFTDISFDVVRGNQARAVYAENLREVQHRGLADRVLFGSDWWNYLYECEDERSFVGQLEVDSGWWRTSDFDAAIAGFLKDVAPAAQGGPYVRSSIAASRPAAAPARGARGDAGPGRRTGPGRAAGRPKPGARPRGPPHRRQGPHPR